MHNYFKNDSLMDQQFEICYETVTKLNGTQNNLKRYV